MLLVLAIVALVATAVIGILVAFANMMSDAPSVQTREWPVWVIGLMITALPYAAWHYGF